VGFTKTAECGFVLVVDMTLAEERTESLAIEVRITSRARDRADIDETVDSM
jgi:hypothetical protein